MHYVNDINLVPKMGQIIKVQRAVSSAPINGLYVILEAAFTIALLGVLLYNYRYRYGYIFILFTLNYLDERNRLNGEASCLC